MPQLKDFDEYMKEIRNEILDESEIEVAIIIATAQRRQQKDECTAC
jgi:hypothetical protein